MNLTEDGMLLMFYVLIILPFSFSGILQNSRSNDVETTTRVCGACQVPFEYDGITFQGCTFYRWESPEVDIHNPMTWCVTNKHNFSEDDATGWEYCTSECPQDYQVYLTEDYKTDRLPTVCDECQFPFQYDNKEFDRCTYYRWYSPNVDYDSPMSWCVTNTTSFLEDEATGWEYCSAECEN